MSFVQDMRTMAPEALKAWVQARLEGQAGPPANSLHGEPVWALLVECFKVWRDDSAQLRAVDEVIAEIVAQGATSQSWSLLNDTCDFASALATLDLPWLASLVQSSTLTNLALNADVPRITRLAALQLLCLTSGAPGVGVLKSHLEASLTDPFVEEDHSGQLPLGLWKALLGAYGGDFHNPEPDVWMKVLDLTRDDAQFDLLREFLFWGWLLASNPFRRAAMADKARACLQGLAFQRRLTVAGMLDERFGPARWATQTSQIRDFSRPERVSRVALQFEAA